MYIIGIHHNYSIDGITYSYNVFVVNYVVDTFIGKVARIISCTLFLAIRILCLVNIVPNLITNAI